MKQIGTKKGLTKDEYNYDINVYSIRNNIILEEHNDKIVIITLGKTLDELDECEANNIRTVQNIELYNKITLFDLYLSKLFVETIKTIEL